MQQRSRNLAIVYPSLLFTTGERGKSVAFAVFLLGFCFGFQLIYAQHMVSFTIYDRQYQPVENAQVYINNVLIPAEKGSATRMVDGKLSENGTITLTGDGFETDSFLIRGGLVGEYFLRRPGELSLPGRIQYPIQPLAGSWIIATAIRDVETGEYIGSKDYLSQIEALGSQLGFSLEQAYPRPQSFSDEGGPSRYFLLKWSPGSSIDPNAFDLPWIDFAGPAFYFHTSGGPPSSVQAKVSVHWKSNMKNETLVEALANIQYLNCTYHESENLFFSEIDFGSSVRSITDMVRILETLNANKYIAWAEPIIWSPE